MVSKNRKKKTTRKPLKTRRKSKKKTQKRRGKKYYGIKNNKVTELYPHKIKKSIGRHKYIILWKTTKENLPGKTFHGKFYKSKEEAIKTITRAEPGYMHPDLIGIIERDL